MMKKIKETKKQLIKRFREEVWTHPILGRAIRLKLKELRKGINEPWFK